MITAISLAHDPSLLGIYGLSGNAQINTLPRVKGGPPANYSHMGDGTAPKAAVAQRAKYHLLPTQHILPIIIINALKQGH